MSDEDIGRNIRRRRVDRGWSQRKLAEAAGVSYSSMSRLEAGRGVRAVTVAAVAAALGVTFEELAAPAGDVSMPTLDCPAGPLELLGTETGSACISESCSCGARFSMRGMSPSAELAALAAGWRETHRCTSKADDDDAADRLGFAASNEP